MCTHYNSIIYLHSHHKWRHRIYVPLFYTPLSTIVPPLYQYPKLQPNSSYISTATTNGDIGYVLPVTESTFRRLNMLENSMAFTLQHQAGMNPRTARFVMMGLSVGLGLLGRVKIISLQLQTGMNPRTARLF